MLLAMKLNLHFLPARSGESAELVRIFGDAQLLRHPSGRWELRGGTAHDRLEAKEWISLFCHEAVFAHEAPRPAVSYRPFRPCLRSNGFGRD